MEDGTGGLDGEAAGGVEAEEPDAGAAGAVADVRADVEFGKVGDAGDRGRETGTRAGHAERDDADEGLLGEGAAGVRVDRERGWNVRAKKIGGDGPVHEEEPAPGHGHRPRGARGRVGAVGVVAGGGRHGGEEKVESGQRRARGGGCSARGARRRGRRRGWRRCRSGCGRSRTRRDRRRGGRRVRRRRWRCPRG